MKKHAGDVLISAGHWPYNKTVQYPQTHHLVRSHKWNNIKVCPGHLRDIPYNVDEAGSRKFKNIKIADAMGITYYITWGHSIFIF